MKIRIIIGSLLLFILFLPILLDKSYCPGEAENFGLNESLHPGCFVDNCNSTYRSDCRYITGEYKYGYTFREINFFGG